MACIFVIDDRDDFLVLVHALLERKGHEVFCYAAADDALAAIKILRPELIITDVYMPGKDGIEFLIELRRIHHSAAILAMSGADLSSDLRQGIIGAVRALGADFMAKPFKTEAFLAKVAELIDTR